MGYDKMEEEIEEKDKNMLNIVEILLRPRHSLGSTFNSVIIFIGIVVHEFLFGDCWESPYFVMRSILGNALVISLLIYHRPSIN